ncbi:MAG: sodium:solute symporter family protein [Nanoarchaeota archaeon]|nr:sodium:solute symporter family protein [Nanoarchaeota archaeon]
MVLSLFNISLIVLYFLIVFLIGLWARKRETTKEFLIAGRKIGTWQTAASIIAVVGGMLLVGQAALAYDMGFGAIWFWVGFSLGLICLGLVAKKIKTLADEHKFLTISDYIFTKFDYKTGILSAIIFFIAFFALLVGQFIAGGSLFAPLLGISYPVAVLIMGFGTLIYLLLGGFKAVIKTDFMQFLIMFFVFIFILFTINIGTFAPEQIDFINIGSFSIIAYLVLGIFAVFAGADVWQRIFSAKDVKTVRKGSYIAAILFVIFGVALTIIGIAAKNNFPNIDSSQALYYGLLQLVPASLVGIAVIAILAALMSTIDTELFYLSSSIAKDFFYRRNKIMEDKIAIIIKISLIGLAIVSMGIAIFVSEILIILFGIISLILCVSPIIVASLFWKIKNNAAFLSLIGGLIAVVFLIITGTFNPDNIALVFPAAAVFLIIGQIFFKKH